MRKHPVHTLSPSMDTGNPSNIERLCTFYRESPSVMKNMVFQETVDDEATLLAMKEAYDQHGLLLDPHSAVAWAAATRRLRNDQEQSHIVVLASGHPGRSAELVERVTGKKPEIPASIRSLEKAIPPVVSIPPLSEALEYIISGACL